jgi:ABC-type multidrug transport system fused ATPase/permease subunit
VAAKILLLVQAFAVFTAQRIVQASALGLDIAFSSTALLILRLARETDFPSTLPWGPSMRTLELVELLNIIALFMSGISIPRRPDVFWKGKLVDREFTQSALSRYTWSWPSEILDIVGEKSMLYLEDLPRLGHRIRTRETVQEWEAIARGRGSVWRSIVRTHIWAFTLQWCAALLAAAFSIGPQWMVLQFLRLLERRTGDTTASSGWIWVAGIGIAMLAQTWAESYVLWLSHSRIALPIRAQLSSLIFRKCLRKEEFDDTKEGTHPRTPTADATESEQKTHEQEMPSTREPEETSASQNTANLVGVDAKRIADFCKANSDIPRSMFKLLLSLALLSNLLGWKPLLVGFATTLVLMPINLIFSRREASIQESLMGAREAKTSAILQVLRGIRQIKFSALESQWEAKIRAFRERELSLLWGSYVNNLLLTGCWIASPILLAVTSLCVYAITHNDFKPSVAFVSLAIFESLEMTISSFPGVLTAMIDAWISVHRIDDYLNGCEKPSSTVPQCDEVVFKDVTISYPTESQHSDDAVSCFVLKNINLTFPKGELTIISGPTGVGKTTLLKAILGEVRVHSGVIFTPVQQVENGAWIVPCAVAYVSQIPWLENTTIQNNIIFGLPYDHVRYLETIRACALEPDIKALTDGDETEVGAGGANLSGGQRWRVTLARALYSRAELLVMDDIFSAVDPIVGRHILEHALTGGLGMGRTRIVATHHFELCKPKARLMVELNRGGACAVYLTSDQSQGQTLQTDAHQVGSHALKSPQSSSNLSCTTLVPPSDPDVGVGARKLAKREMVERGAVKREVYATFINASGGWSFWISAAVLYISVQLIVVGRAWWVKNWTAASQHNSRHGEVAHQMIQQQPYMQPSIFYAVSSNDADYFADLGTYVYLGVYIAIAVSTAVLSIWKQYYILTGSIKAHKQLFATLNSAIIHAPLWWLDNVPVGRILNRMTSDFFGIETAMPYAIIYLATALLNLLSVIAVGISLSPVILAFASVCLAMCVWFASLYLGVARSLKRLESTTRSPIYDQFNSSLAGVVTIRSFNKTSDYIERMDEKIDDLTVASWYLQLFNGWIAWRVGIVSAVFASLVASTILLKNGVSASLAGLVMALTLELSGYIMQIIQRYSNMELEMNAVERIIEYCDIPIENPGGELPPAAWPTDGLVEVENLFIGYGDLKPALNNITFTIQPRERIGVVGRTGAGKSTLAQAVLRIMEAQSGSIRIDGIDISRLKLHALRSRVAIVPQDPVLFAGTVRSNLDPFNVHTERELRDTIKQIHLAPDSLETDVTDFQSDIPDWLDLSSPISEGGLNLSQGQRQLLCLARLIITPSKVIILDEATSAIDIKTDELMQRSIRQGFTNNTLLVIAHRLSTIADFDRILVLEHGHVVEFGTPRELWEKGVLHGKFRGMCEQSGERDQLERTIQYGSK